MEVSRNNKSTAKQSNASASTRSQASNSNSNSASNRDVKNFNASANKTKSNKASNTQRLPQQSQLNQNARKPTEASENQQKQSKVAQTKNVQPNHEHAVQKTNENEPRVTQTENTQPNRESAVQKTNKNDTEVPQANYPSFDGSGNNIERPELGKANTEFRDILPKDFSRQPGTPTESALPSPREVSNAVAAQTGQTQNKKGLNDLFWLWGQFLDHDINLTPTSNANTAPIKVPQGDPFFDPRGTGTEQIPFNRSVTSNTSGEPKTINAITPYIDASNVYGSDKSTADSLRSFQGGRLQTSDNNLLPSNAEGQFVAGDERANENIGLSTIHTLWVRAHNNTADQLSSQNPSWDDEKIFQEARNKVISQVQAITYNEFLPALLGNNTLSPYQGYNPNVSPQITDSFSTAAYRLGHTLLSPNLLRLDEQGKEISQGNVALKDAFRQPDKVREAGIEPIIRGAASQTAQAVDPMIVDDVRNFLFGPPGNGGFDLASLNIQRGRDHALPGYNDARNALGLASIQSSNDPVFQDGAGEKLAAVYRSPNDVDLWVGGLSEKSQGDSLVGETFTTILKEQFENLRDGDRFWYENRLSPQQVNMLNQLRLSDIIKLNTTIQNIQHNALVASNIHQQQNPLPNLPPVAAT